MIREADLARKRRVEIGAALAGHRAAGLCRISPTRPCGWRAPADGKMRRIMRSDWLGRAGFRIERGGVGRILGVLQQRIAFELRIDESRELEMGQLQQLDRLQQLRRHGQGLPLPQLQPLRSNS